MPYSKSSVEVTVVEALDIHGVDHYQVQIKNNAGKFCEAKPGRLSCIIGGLQPAQQYTIESMACLDGQSGPDPCNRQAAEGKGWTKPSRKFYTVILYSLFVRIEFVRALPTLKSSIILMR